LFDAINGDIERPQPVRVEHDLILLDESPDTRDFGDVQYAFQLILQKPVLQRAQLRDVVVPAVIDERVFVDPPYPGAVRT